MNKYMVEFCPINSLIHKVNAVIKLIGLLFLFMVIFVTNDLIMVMFGLILTFFLIAFSNIPILYYWKIILAFLYVYFLIAIFLVLIGIDVAIVGIVILKLILVIVNIMLVVHTTSIDDLLTGTMKFVNIFNIFFINMNKLGIRICQVFKFIPTLYQTGNQILNSQASRGIDYRYTTIIGRWGAIFSCFFRILMVTKERLRLLGITMEQRLFSLNKTRRRLDFSKLNVGDFIYIMIHFLIVFYYIMRVK